MTALHYTLKLNQGETSSLIFPVLDEFGAPVTITGWTAKAQIRSAPGIPTVLYEWSATNGNIPVAGSTWWSARSWYPRRAGLPNQRALPRSGGWRGRRGSSRLSGIATGCGGTTRS